MSKPKRQECRHCAEQIRVLHPMHEARWFSAVLVSPYSQFRPARVEGEWVVDHYTREIWGWTRQGTLLRGLTRAQATAAARTFDRAARTVKRIAERYRRYIR